MLLLRRSRVSTVARSNGEAVRTLTQSQPLLQIQNRDRVMGTHGVGLVSHESMARVTPNAIQSMMHVTRAAPAADLFRTEVHEGLGTSAQDPYVRTLPNQESMPPESTVLAQATTTAPTLDECAELGRTKWAGMQYWMADTFARLPIYIRQLLCPDALPVSRSAERLVGQFVSHVAPALMEARPRADYLQLVQLWQDAVARFDMSTNAQLNARLLFDRAAFEAHVATLHAQTAAVLRAVCPRDEVVLALEVLRRKAVLQRNAFVEERLLRPLDDGLHSGVLVAGGAWRVFFDAVAAAAPDTLFPPNASDDGGGSALLAYAWQALQREDAPRTPSLTAPVALYLALLCHGLSRGARSTSAMDAAKKAQGLLSSAEPPYATLDPITKRRLVAKVLQEQVLNSEQGYKALAKALQTATLHQLSREAALCEAMCDEQQLLETDCAALAERFSSTGEVKSLLSSLLRGTDVAACQHVAKTFGLSSSSSRAANGDSQQQQQQVNWDAVMTRVDWPANWRRLAIALLSDRATLVAVHRLVRNAIGAKGVVRHLFSESYEEALREAIRVRDERSAAKTARVATLVRELSSYELVDQTLRLLRELNVNLDELDQTSAAAMAERTSQQQPQQPVPEVTVELLQTVLQAVGKRHPSWLRARVLPSDKRSDAAGDGEAVVRLSSLSDALRVMLRIYIRLAYVPQAGAAAIAQHTRHRIGAVGKEVHQFNIGAEMGFVEQYDNLQYKRYDWQGWYQRMVDVHNRNVSIRCRVDDLKHLDALGEPFVDLQTERRLRILAADRVGMGVVKLDSDKYEDQADNITYGSGKLSELLADARKAQLGPEYWPTVEVKVRRPSGQSQAHYSLIDYDRIEERSKELYAKYREAKKRSLFVTPMDTWLVVKGMQTNKSSQSADVHGYTIDDMHGGGGKAVATPPTDES